MPDDDAGSGFSEDSRHSVDMQQLDVPQVEEPDDGLPFGPDDFDGDDGYEGLLVKSLLMLIMMTVKTMKSLIGRSRRKKRTMLKMLILMISTGSCAVSSIRMSWVWKSPRNRLTVSSCMEMSLSHFRKTGRMAG